jgi:hypothetical protein
VGKPTVDVYGPTATMATISLRSASGALRGTARVRPAPGGASTTGTFRKNGQPVKVKAGDRVTDSQAPGVVLRVLTPDLQLDPSGNGSLTATCFQGADYAVGELFGNGALSFIARGTAHPGGALSVADLVDSGPLPSGFRVQLSCETRKGFTQTMTKRVP